MIHIENEIRKLQEFSQTVNTYEHVRKPLAKNFQHSFREKKQLRESNELCVRVKENWRARTAGCSSRRQ